MGLANAIKLKNRYHKKFANARSLKGQYPNIYKQIHIVS